MINYIVAFGLFPIAAFWICAIICINKIEIVFVRALEVASVGIAITLFLHFYGILEGDGETVAAGFVGLLAWGLAAFAGEYSQMLEHRDPQISLSDIS